MVRWLLACLIVLVTIAAAGYFALGRQADEADVVRIDGRDREPETDEAEPAESIAVEGDQQRPQGDEIAEAAVASTSTTAAPPTTAFVPLGDLGLSVPLAPIDCAGPANGKYVVFLRSSIDPASFGREIADGLAANPGSSYLRTDQTACWSLRQAGPNGDPIYAVFYGPFDTFGEACSILSALPAGDQYVKTLDQVTDPSTFWTRATC